jgi:hypothetical protein
LPSGNRRGHFEFGGDQSVAPRLPLEELSCFAVLLGDPNDYFAARQCHRVRQAANAVHAAAQRNLAAGGVVRAGRHRGFMRLHEQRLGDGGFECPVADADANAPAVRFGFSDGELGQVLAVRRRLVDVLPRAVDGDAGAVEQLDEERSGKRFVALPGQTDADAQLIVVDNRGDLRLERLAACPALLPD